MALVCEHLLGEVVLVVRALFQLHPQRRLKAVPQVRQPAEPLQRRQQVVYVDKVPAEQLRDGHDAGADAERDILVGRYQEEHALSDIH